MIKRRARLIDVAADRVQVLRQGLAGDAVVVPVGVIELDEPHALARPAGGPAGSCSRTRACPVRRRTSQRRGRLRPQVDQLRGARLHPVGHLVGGDPGGDLGVGRHLQPSPVQLGRSSRWSVAGWLGEMPDGVARSRIGSPPERSGTPWYAGEKPASPVHRAAARPARARLQHDEPGRLSDSLPMP